MQQLNTLQPQQIAHIGAWLKDHGTTIGLVIAGQLMRRYRTLPDWDELIIADFEEMTGQSFTYTTDRLSIAIDEDETGYTVSQGGALQIQIRYTLTLYGGKLPAETALVTIPAEHREYYQI